MSKQTFVANTILTAAQMNTLQTNDYNQTVSTKTASYTLVAADAGTKIVMNSASATTITVNTSLFAAGDNLTIANISTGVCTVTAGTAIVSSAGPLAIPQYGTGTLYFTSAGVSIYSPTAVTAAAASSGLTFLSGQTLTAAATLSITNVFSATYTSYLFITSQMNQANDTDNTFLRFGSSGSPDTDSNYSICRSFSSSGNNQSSFNIMGNSGTTDNYFVATFTNPNVAARTFMSYTLLNNPSAGVVLNMGAGLIDTNTQYTDMFFTCGSGNMGGMKYQLFGYSNS